MKTFLDKVNVAKHVSNHLIGEHHTPGHRKIVGVLIMVFGVSLVKTLGSINSLIIHFLADIVGYAIHGIGLIPFVHDLEGPKPKENDNHNNTIHPDDIRELSNGPHAD